MKINCACGKFFDHRWLIKHLNSDYHFENTENNCFDIIKIVVKMENNRYNYYFDGHQWIKLESS